MKKFIPQILYYTGVNSIAGLLLRHRLSVVNFHSVSNAENSNELMTELYPDLTISVEQFEARIQYLLKQQHTFITLADLDHGSLENVSKPTILYFDDGFRDNLVNVLPILQKYHIQAVFFLTTGLISRTHLMWSVKHRLFLKTKGQASEAIEREIHWLRKHNSSGRPAELEALYQREGFAPDLSTLPIFLTWDEVRTLQQAGMEIGSHSVTHPYLTQISAEALRVELSDSYQTIKQELGVAPVSLSFPHGRYNNEVKTVAGEIGYQNLVSAGLGLNQLSSLTIKPRLLSNVLNRPSDSLIEFSVNLYSANLLRAKK